jgi:hypothetical protein
LEGQLGHVAESQGELLDAFDNLSVEKSHGVHLLLRMLTGHVKFGTKIYQNVIQEEIVEDVDQR